MDEKFGAPHGGEETMYNLLLGAAADPNQKDAYGPMPRRFWV